MKLFTENNQTTLPIKALMLSSILASTSVIAADMHSKTATETQLKSQINAQQREIARLNQLVSILQNQQQQKIDSLMNQVSEIENQIAKKTQSKMRQYQPVKRVERVEPKKLPATTSMKAKTSNPVIKTVTNKPKPNIIQAKNNTKKMTSIPTTQVTVTRTEGLMKKQPRGTSQKPAVIQIRNKNTASETFLKALKALSADRHDIAITELKKYITQYPNDYLIPKAHYWLGESYIQKKPANYPAARKEFLDIIGRYNNSANNDKQSKALFRLVQISKINNNQSELRKYLRMLETRYPNSEEMKLAKQLVK